jgi:hypothetical protein
MLEREKVFHFETERKVTVPLLSSANDGLTALAISKRARARKGRSSTRMKESFMVGQEIK